MRLANKRTRQLKHKENFYVSNLFSTDQEVVILVFHSSLERHAFSFDMVFSLKGFLISVILLQQCHNCRASPSLSQKCQDGPILHRILKRAIWRAEAWWALSAWKLTGDDWLQYGTKGLFKQNCGLSQLCWHILLEIYCALVQQQSWIERNTVTLISGQQHGVTKKNKINPNYFKFQTKKIPL